MKNTNLDHYCENIRNQYLDYISLEQFRIICRIAKRTASYLLTNGIVPAIDTGKKTCRYRIKVEDVITYLQSVKTAFCTTSSGVTVCKVVNPKILRKTYTDFITQVPKLLLLNFLEQKYSNYPDVMTTAEMAEISGLFVGTIQRYIKLGTIKVLKINRASMVPKKYAFDFIMSEDFIGGIGSVEHTVKLSHDLEKWLETHAQNDCGVA